MNILLVENSEDDIVQISKSLKKFGYDQVYTATNTIDAINILISESVDLLIIDVMVSDMGGINACKKIRRMSKGKDLIIIAMIQNDREELIQDAFIAGVNDFIRKPISNMEFIARINFAENVFLEKKQRKIYEQQLEEDLILAKNFQRSVLTPDVVNKEIIMRSYYDPCQNVGGDMYCWHKINDHQYGVMIYDVMGHGIASSLVNMSIYTLTKSIITRFKKPDLVMKEFNRQVYFLLQQGESMDVYYVTGTYLLIDKQKQTIAYVNAGHPIGFVFNTVDEIQPIKPTAPFIGVVRGLPVEVKEIELKKNSQIILYTDGLKDYLNISYQALEKLFQETLMNKKESFIKTFIQTNDLSAKIKKDDICLLSILVK